MKRVLVMVLVCALLAVSVAGRPLPAVKAAGEVLYAEVPQDSYCRAPATTAYLSIMLGNLSDQGTMSIRCIEVLDESGTSALTETRDIALESMARSVRSGEEIRTALGIVPPTAADITTARTLLAEAMSTADRKQKSILVEQAFFASRAKQSMKNPDELTTDEATIQHLLKTTTLAVDLTQFTTDTTSETAVLVTVRITGELSGQPFTLDQQTTVFLLASLPNGGMWHPGDGHVHTSGQISGIISQPDDLTSYPLAARENYGFSDATDAASVLDRRDQANSKGLQWIVMTDHAGDNGGGDHMSQPAFQGRLEAEEWSIYQAACSRATTGYYPTVTVCPGEELATKEIPEWWVLPTGHLLSYANSSYAASYGNGTCQSLTSSALTAGGFGIVAHPNTLFVTWSDWTATPWNGIEVVSNTATSWDDPAVSRWDQQLLAKLTDELADATSYRCVAMANSDVHNSSSWPTWGSNMNYIYTGSYSVPGTSPSAVWNAIKQGSLTASSDGSFAAATVNGTYPGYKATVTRNSTVSVFVTGTQVSSTYTTARIRIIRNGSVVLSPPDFTISGSNFTQNYSITIPENSYVRVEVLYGTTAGWLGKCFVNPVFVAVTG
jgi:hypothetical protein